MARHITIKPLGIVRKHLGVFYNIGMDQDGPYIEANMVEFAKGMTNDFKSMIGSLPKSVAKPALAGTTLKKNQSNPIQQPEYRSIVGKLLYFMKKVSPLCMISI